MSKRPFRGLPPEKRETSTERRKRHYSYSSRVATPDRMAAHLGKWALTSHELTNNTSTLPTQSWVRVISTNNYSFNVTTDSCPCCRCTQIFRNVEPHWLDFETNKTAHARVEDVNENLESTDELSADDTSARELSADESSTDAMSARELPADDASARDDETNQGATS